MQLKRVVVTGLGALTPIGNTVDAYWNGLIAGKSGAAPIKQFDASLFKTQFACEVKDFNVEDFIDKKRSSEIRPIYSLCLSLSDGGSRGLWSNGRRTQP